MKESEILMQINNIFAQLSDQMDEMTFEKWFKVTISFYHYSMHYNVCANFVPIYIDFNIKIKKFWVILKYLYEQNNHGNAMSFDIHYK